MTNWQAEFEAELARAAQARARNNEGQARVCARRAAGIAIREHLKRRGLPVKSSSAYDLLNEMVAAEDLPAEAREAARLLALRVDEAFKLPAGVDLVIEARRLAKALRAA